MCCLYQTTHPSVSIPNEQSFPLVVLLASAAWTMACGCTTQRAFQYSLKLSANARETPGLTMCLTTRKRASLVISSIVCVVAWGAAKVCWLAAHAALPVLRERAYHDIVLSLSVLTSCPAAAQGAVIAPTLISVSPVRTQVGTSRFNASPIGISVGVAEAQDANSTFSDGTAPGTLAGAGR